MGSISNSNMVGSCLEHVWNMFSCTVKVTDERIEKLDSTLDFFIVTT